MIRKARMAEVHRIQKMLEGSARKGELLPRSLSELYDSIRDFQVCEEGEDRIIGFCALHPTWESLGEIRSLFVRDEARRRGIGRQLVGRCLEEGRELGIDRVFVLTFNTAFFQKLGFVPVDKAMLPHKIWTDCIHCIHFPDCKEQSLWIDLHSGPDLKRSRGDR
ncbi:MAG: N-acetyltransferase [bacterium]